MKSRTTIKEKNLIAFLDNGSCWLYHVKSVAETVNSFYGLEIVKFIAHLLCNEEKKAIEA